MLDPIVRKLIDPPLNRIGAALAARGLGANTVTLIGLGLGLCGAALIVIGHPFAAIIPLLASRCADGLDGAIARTSGPTDFGGYLDITADFFFYGVIPMAFIWLDPASNGIAGAFLLTSFYVNGTSFLGYAILAEKYNMKTTSHGIKSLYYTGGLLEGTETNLFILLLCLMPHWFVPMAWIFGSFCFITALMRSLLARKVFTANLSRGSD